MGYKVWMKVLGISVILHLMIFSALAFYIPPQTMVEKKAENAEVIEVALGEQPSFSVNSKSSKGENILKISRAANELVSKKEQPRQIAPDNLAAATGELSPAAGEKAASTASASNNSGLGAKGAVGSSFERGSGERTGGSETEGKSAYKTSAVAVVYSPRPEYPEIARTNGWEGTVQVRVQISPEGSVMKAVIVSSSGYDNIDAAAISGVTKWRFTPAYKNGKPVFDWAVVPITFTLHNKI